MDEKTVAIWCNELKNAWLKKDFVKITQLFSKTSLYYEDPFSDPGTTIEEINSYWEEIENQMINELIIEPILVADSRAAIHWYLDYMDIQDSSTYILDGIYIVEFNSASECIYFKQWWVAKE